MLETYRRSWRYVGYGKNGRNPYFERRNGKRMISPDEQELIADVARQVGVMEEFEFDSYTEQYDWTN